MRVVLSYTKYKSFFPSTFYSLSLKPSNYKNHLTFHSPSTHIHSFINLSFYYISLYFLFSSKHTLKLSKQKIETLSLYSSDVLKESDYFNNEEVCNH